MKNLILRFSQEVPKEIFKSGHSYLEVKLKFKQYLLFIQPFNISKRFAGPFLGIFPMGQIKSNLNRKELQFDSSFQDYKKLKESSLHGEGIEFDSSFMPLFLIKN